MSKIVAPRILSMVLGLFFTIAIAQNSFAQTHESPDNAAAVEHVDETQNPQWKNAPLPQDLANKRLSQFALDKQLDANKSIDTNNSLFYWLISLIVIMLLIVLGTAMKLLNGLSKISGATTKEPNYDKLNGNMFLAFLFVFMGAILYEIMIHKQYLLPESASKHGQSIDMILWITFALTGFVFVVTQALLFIFAFKYRQKEGQTAIYYPKNDKLEILWTTIPAVVLTLLVLFGFRIWVNTTITNANAEEYYEIELYAYQFGWKFRYPGPDGKLGRTDYRLTNTELPGGTVNAIALDITDPASADDIVKDELILPKGVMVKLRMRSRDVLHAAHLPHFRAQMYCVPGTPTQFNLEPLYTTEEFRSRINKPDFNFELACNQICGASHYAMKREIKVVELKDYTAWMSSEKPLFTSAENSNTNQLTLK